MTSFTGRRIIDQSLLALTFLAFVILLAMGARSAAPPAVPVPREVLAFYYGWYGTPAVSKRWVHWEGVDVPGRTTSVTTNYPTTGVYDSHDPAMIEHQLSQMKRAGLTGFVSSWWGQGSFEDASLGLLMGSAARHGLKVSAYYEQIPDLGAKASAAARIDAVVGDLRYLLQRYAAQPAWLKVGGRPVIFVFRRAVGDLGPDGWWIVRQRLQGGRNPPLLIADVDLNGPVGPVTTAFGGVHAYNNSDVTGGKSLAELQAWAGRTYAAWTRKWSSTVTAITIMPGFDNRRAAKSPAGSRATDRYGGATYAALGDAAIAAKPDWLLITSWNEWHEGSEIEPSTSHGGTALEQTGTIARRFRALPPRSIRLR
jgi:glycoprotein endo-alpha-1,2-mannosidase